MSRWIDADALIEKINTAFWSEIGKVIDEAPSIDIEDYVPKAFHDKTCEALCHKHRKEVEAIERKCGEWEYVYRGKWMFRRCSCCKWTQTYDDSKYMGYRYNFCPNCGAKMDGERRE